MCPTSVGKNPAAAAVPGATIKIAPMSRMTL